jgi:soluble lytic murein transglycosylase-like protein
MREGRFLSMDRKTMRCLSLTIFAISLILCPVSARAFCFEEAGRANNISYDLLESIARVESGLNANALHVNRNGTTDLGLMQINSAWIEPMRLNREELISNPCYNVMAGAGILRQCIDAHGYTWEAVGCYNAKSKGKRVGYSWKIFRELKKEKARKIANKKESLPENASPGQSLYFRVREAENTALGEKP